ncbi:Alcohol dehydrogenase II [Hyphodiscus hymeniophilus]|uniref:Alcohol dehydrogenase II n=1 Tax=Hyphodiscus hymeniophilus TaxID=353542 RepID=A0A9P6SMT3_9HELO|nr:Alcohol dehydrogenase II [Hyphodiscus hymeniophilus]
MAPETKRNKAVVYAEPGSSKTSIQYLDIPIPGDGQILVKLYDTPEYHVIILEHDDVDLSNTVVDQETDQVGGHEGVGEVIGHGPGVTEPSIGTRVGIKWLAEKISGYYTPGTFQQYVTTSASYATPIPDGIDSSAAAPLLCAGLTVYSGLQKTGAKPGDWVVISGAGGGLGHLAVQYASRVMGLRVIAIDSSSKESLCKECGSEEFLDFMKHSDDELEEKIKKIANNGRGANAVLVVSAANKSYEQGLKFLKPQGTMVCIGMPEGTPVAIQSAYPARITSQQFRIIGSAIGNRREALEALEFAARGLVKCHYAIKKMEDLTQV